MLRRVAALSTRSLRRPSSCALTTGGPAAVSRNGRSPAAFGTDVSDAKPAPTPTQQATHVGVRSPPPADRLTMAEVWLSTEGAGAKRDTSLAAVTANVAAGDDDRAVELAEWLLRDDPAAAPWLVFYVVQHLALRFEPGSERLTALVRRLVADGGLDEHVGLAVRAMQRIPTVVATQAGASPSDSKDAPRRSLDAQERYVWLLESIGFRPNVVMINVLIDGSVVRSEDTVSVGGFERARHYLGQMVARGLEPDEFSYATVIDAACREHKYDECFALADELASQGVVLSGILVARLIRVCGFARRPQLIARLLDGLVASGRASPRALAMAHHNALGAAVRCQDLHGLRRHWASMRERGLSPIGHTAVALLSALEKARLSVSPRATELLRTFGLSEKTSDKERVLTDAEVAQLTEFVDTMTFRRR